jgi:hypothetical protein
LSRQDDSDGDAVIGLSKAGISAAFGHKNIFRIGLVTAAGLIIIAMLALARFAQPMADDFAFANSYRAHGLIGSQAHWYHDWTGRYTSTAAITIFTGIGDLASCYWIVPAILIAGTLAAFNLLARIPRSSTSYPMNTWLIALIAFSIYATRMPSTAEGFYWLAGGFTYQLSVIAFSVLLYALWSTWNAADGSVAKWAAIASLAIVWVVGCNETFMAVAVVALGWFFLSACLRRSGLLITVAAVLLALSLACTAFVMSSPGNHVRLALMPERHGHAHSVIRALSQTASLSGGWLVDPALLVATCLAACWGARDSTMDSPFFSALSRQPWRFSIAWISVLAVTLLPSWWARGEMAEARVENATWFIFLIGWLANSVAWSSWLFRRYRLAARPTGKPVKPSSRAIGWFQALLAISLLASPISRAMFHDLASVAPAQYAELQARHKLIEESLRARTPKIEVPGLTRFPMTLYTSDITTDPGNWLNQAYASYFGLSEITSK